MEWIKVEDQLPEEGARCLVVVSRPAEMGYRIELANRYTHKPAVKHRNLDDNFLITGIVSHWQYSPKLPDLW